MSPTKSLTWIMVYFSSLGLLLSGYLSYHQLFVPAGCGRALLTCGTNPVEIIGVSQCIYGFAMFLIATVLGGLILRSQQPSRFLTIQFGVALVGTLFAGSLSVYELWIRTPAPLTMPSCVYGFFLYLGILITTSFARKMRSV